MAGIGITRHGGRKWCVRVVNSETASLEWECPKCGHHWKARFLVGPRGMRKPLHAGLLAKFARYWNKENGGANAVCPKCEKGK